MLAAFAISGTNASEPATDETPTTEAAPAPEAAEPAAEPAKPAAKKKGTKRHAAEAMGDAHKAKHHRRKHPRHGGSGHMVDKWDQPWDYIQQGGDSSGCSGDSSDESPRMPVPEIPGQKTP